MNETTVHKTCRFGPLIHGLSDLLYLLECNDNDEKQLRKEDYYNARYRLTERGYSYQIHRFT